jgi:threonine dehydrogenase-like Zn-dependent dehydrogenase
VLLGAERVIAIDRFPERLRMAAQVGKAETLDYSRFEVLDALKDLTGGRGPDACIDAVGLEAHGCGLGGMLDWAMQQVMLETDRPIALREAIMACRPGGVVSIPGVYGGILDKIPFGALMNKGLTVKTGQTHVQRYLRPLLERIERGEFQPAAIVTHKLPLDRAADGYRLFNNKEDECVKVVLKP